MFRIVVSAAAAARLGAASRFLADQSPSAEVLIVGASRGAADDLARSAARRHGATFGLTRFSLTELAARSAAARLAGQRRAASTDAGSQALAARAVFDALAARELTYFQPVASTPGFPRALARTLHELRLAGVTAGRLARGGKAASDLARLMARVEEELAAAQVDDRAALFRLAVEGVDAGEILWSGLPLILLDLTADSHAELAFIAALVRRAPDVLATLPEGDGRARQALADLGGSIEAADDTAHPDSDLAHLRRYLFTTSRPPLRDRAGDVRLFSAPGEARETLEIVRRVLDEAERGVRFDEMAVFLRSPQQYIGLLEHACARAGVPVAFDRGTRRPDPAGRAFIALLSCAVEGLSARRFDEYLSLGQVPQLHSSEEPAVRLRPRDGIVTELTPDVEENEDPLASPFSAPPADSDDEAIVEGTLRAPWKWEELIVESAVVGGRSRRDGKARWRRRLNGLAGEYRLQLEELARQEPENPRLPRLVRDLRNLAHLRGFALPLIDVLADWPDEASWGEWLDRFEALAAHALRRPQRVRQVLADLRPMATVGPVSLEEARDALHDRLVTLDWDPPSRRYGRLFVGTAHQARGREFRVVFVPGLAERIVPQRPREDPLLLDDARARIGAALVDQEARGSAERLLLRIAIGTASDRLYLSFPRMDVGETRARVPSFYALDVVRAMTGRVPDYRVLAAEAAGEAGATLAWPAPSDPDRAIDDLEHDLAVLKPLLESRDASAKGRARYMLELNEALRRSVIRRWERGRRTWSPSDGLVRITPATATAVSARRLARRPYSLSALQRFAACPYQFLLATVHRLEAWEEPEPLVRLDPLTRGSLFHRIQAEFCRLLAERKALPVTPESLAENALRLDEVIRRVADEYAEQLAPAIERVWADEVSDLRRDLGIWLQKLADEREWVGAYFEFSFGLSDQGRDPHSVKDPVLVDGRFLLRGSVDVIERHRDRDLLRITDHKTGRNRSNPDLIVGGGATLQPVLYGIAIEQALGKQVAEGRLFYATTAGGFAEHRIALNDYARRQGLQVLEIIDRAIDQGFLPAAPQKDACRWCDFRPVCGPREEERVAHKSPDRVADLEALRSMR